MTTENDTDAGSIGWAESLALIPQALGVLLMGGVAAIMITMLYFFAYLVPVAGLLLAIGGLLTLNPVGFFVGLLIAGFGGLVYLEWFEEVPGNLPKATEILRRVKTYAFSVWDHSAK